MPIHLEPTPDTVHWGFFDARLAPLATIQSGERVTISDEGKRLEAQVVTRPFYDPDGEVLRS